MSGKNICLLAGGLLAAALVAGGVYYFNRTPEPTPPPVNQKPDDKQTARRKFEIQVDCPGLSPEEVGVIVVAPLVEAVRTVKGVGPIHSIGVFGRARLIVPVTEGDQFKIRQDAMEAIARIAPQLPAGIDAPRLVAESEERLPDVLYAVSSDTRSLSELARYTDWILAKELRQISGVAQVTIEGTGTLMPVIHIDPDRLRAYEVDLSAVAAALDADALMKKPDGPAKVGEIVVAKKNDTPIYLRDVAQVGDDQARSGFVHYRGRRVVAISVYFSPDQDRGEIDKRLKAAEEAWKAKLPEGMGVTRALDPNESDANDLLLEIQLPDGASVERTEDAVRRFERDITARLGDGIRSTLAICNEKHANHALLFVSLNAKGKAKDDAIRGIREVERQHPAFVVRVLDLGTQPPPRTTEFPIRFAIVGDNHADIGQALLESLRQAPGIADADSRFRRQSPQLRLRIDRTRAAELGVSVADINRTLELATGGKQFGNGRFLIRLGAEFRGQPEELQNLWLKGKDDRIVRLKEVAAIEHDFASTRIEHLDGQPCMVITAGLEPGTSIADAEKTIRKLAEQNGARIEFLP